MRVPRRDEVLARLHAEGIGAGIHYPVPLHLHGAFATSATGAGDFPVAERAAGGDPVAADVPAHHRRSSRSGWRRRCGERWLEGAMETPSTARRVLRFAAQILLILGIAELTLDAGLWARRFVLGLRTHEQAKDDAFWHEDDYLRGRIVPRQKHVRIGPAQASINSLGLRGAEPRGAPYRIVCLGDSVTFGWGISRDDATYPAALGQALGRRDVEVLNAGMPRWNSCDLMDLYVTRIAAIRPQTLVVLAGWNDIGYALPRLSRRRRRPPGGSSGARLMTVPAWRT